MIRRCKATATPKTRSRPTHGTSTHCNARNTWNAETPVMSVLTQLPRPLGTHKSQTGIFLAPNRGLNAEGILRSAPNSAVAPPTKADALVGNAG